MRRFSTFLGTTSTCRRSNGTGHATFCPYKGDCAYYSIVIGGRRSINAVWTYEAPYPAVAEIRGHLAFYPERVDAIEERPDACEERVEV